jgi:hypothetical protein
VSTKNFEDVLISAACKKKRGKLWQKERARWARFAYLFFTNSA